MKLTSFLVDGESGSDSTAFAYPRYVTFESDCYGLGLKNRHATADGSETALRLPKGYSIQCSE